MNLGNPGPAYDQGNESQARRTLEQEDKRNVKKGEIFDKILMRDTVTLAVVTVTVASGVLVVTP